MAYEVEEEDWPAVLDALDVRERHGYTRRMGGCVFSPNKKVMEDCFDMEDCWGSAIQNHAIHEARNAALETS